MIDILMKLSGDVTEAVRQAEIHTRGWVVKLHNAPGVPERYVGRQAVIHGVLPSAQHGLRFCCMVTRREAPWSMLNSDSDSRAYRPLDHFEFIGMKLEAGKLVKADAS